MDHTHTHTHTHVPALAGLSLPLFADLEIALIIYTVNKHPGLLGTEQSCSNTGVCVCGRACVCVAVRAAGGNV